MIDQTCQEAGYITARPLEGWLDDGWPGEGVFPHTVAYGSGMCIFAGGFCGGAGDGGGACVHHVRDVRRRHESRSRTFMVESRRVSSRSCFEFVAGVRDLAEKFQGRGVRGSKISLRDLKKKVDFEIFCMQVCAHRVRRMQVSKRVPL